jgi:integrase
MAKLNSRFVETAPPGKYGDAITKGLQLVVAQTGARKWVLRFMSQGKAREMGLGSFPEVGLAEAREKARAARKLVKDGVDPIVDRQRDRGVPTFGELADEVVAEQSKGFRNDKHKAQWAMTLTVYAEPLRPKPVDKVETVDVLAVLKPIWLEKPETASRVRGRIERVLNAAKAKGYRTGENPAAWRGHLENLLPKQSKLLRGHHAALPYADVPAFITKLREREAIAALALEFCILTATRTTETLEARWEEIDLDAKVWTIPPARTKAAREHRVPLSDQALAVLAKLNEASVSDFVFPGGGRGPYSAERGQKRKRPLSSMAMEMVLRRMGVDDDVTVHGFRSSFRDWAGNETQFPRELAEHALAHIVGDKAEQAYRRDAALERRRPLMDAWARHCDGPRKADVISLAARRDAALN